MKRMYLLDIGPSFSLVSFIQLGIIETISFNSRPIETIGFNRFNRFYKRQCTRENVHHEKSQTWSP